MVPVMYPPHATASRISLPQRSVIRMDSFAMTELLAMTQKN